MYCMYGVFKARQSQLRVVARKAVPGNEQNALMEYVEQCYCSSWILFYYYYYFKMGWSKDKDIRNVMVKHGLNEVADMVRQW